MLLVLLVLLVCCWASQHTALKGPRGGPRVRSGRPPGLRLPFSPRHGCISPRRPPPAGRGSEAKRYDTYMDGTCLSTSREALAAAKTKLERADANRRTAAARLRTAEEALGELRARERRLLGGAR